MMQDMSMHILDIAQNSIRAGATEITIKINEDITDNLFAFSIMDNGCGIPKKMLGDITNPFTTSRDTRKVGLGIPMLNETCEACGGFLALNSTEGEGTYIEANMLYDHVDRPPLGDIIGAIHILIVSNPEINFEYAHKHNEKDFSISTKDMKKELQDVPINDPSVISWLKEFIEEGINEIRK